MASQSRKAESLRSAGLLVIALALGAIFLLSPVKAWLNGHPWVWRILYPALSMYGIYGLALSLRDKARWRYWLPWLVLVLASLSATLWVFDVGMVFYTIGRYAAITFVVVEVLLTIVDIIKPEPAV